MEAMREATRALRPPDAAPSADRGEAPYPTEDRALSAPATAVPLERGRLVVDLGTHPVPLARGRRFVAEGGGPVVLLVRVTVDHFAAVDADCPHCGGALSFDVPEDAVLCPVGQAAYRMDGRPVRGPADLRIRSHPCHRAGPRVEVAMEGGETRPPTGPV